MANPTQDSTNTWPTFLNQTILDTLATQFEFNKMTPVQSVVIPIFTLKHKDVVVEAVTGSGKTLSFVVPIIDILLKRDEKLRKHDIGALIISPTRELAIQIFEVVQKFKASLPDLSTILFVGGTNPTDDLNSFQENGGNIIVCTAGRLEDLMSRKNHKINLLQHIKSLEILILDEADRLLDMGFRKSINNIFLHLPKQRRTGLFSATQTDEIEKLIKAGLRNPCYIQVKQKGSEENKQRTPINLKNYYMIVEPNEKFYKLVEFLKQNKNGKYLIFMSTCACVQYFSRLLKVFLKKTEVLSLHRKLKEKRNKVFTEFRKLTSGILVCTDLLSRGIDIDDVDWVVQYDLPTNASSFVHRCGRTARSDREGNAIVFLLPNEDCYTDFIRLNQNVPLEPYTLAADPQTTESDVVKKIQTLASQEREVYEKGKEAFVSYTQSYTKHECSHILRVKELDFGKLATGFGLLHLPKMPEIKANVQYDRVDVDTSKIPYKEKHKEKERQKQIETRGLTKKSKFKPKVSVPWSNKKEVQLKRKIKRDKKDIIEKRKRDEIENDNDFDELEKDFKLLKKLKKKKITEAEFDEIFVPNEEESVK